MILGKTLSIRCVIESVASMQYWDLLHSSGHVEVDRQANVPVHTVFHKLVEAVLQIFGFPKENALTAKGITETKASMHPITKRVVQNL